MTERDRLAALLREIDGNHDMGAADLADRLIAAGVSLAPRPEGLDVERLARALVFQRYGLTVEDANPADVQDAGVIIREYARLSDTGERPYIAPPMQDWDKP